MKKSPRRVSPNSPRIKISTTVSPATADFLREMLRKGPASSLAEALDQVVAHIRELEARRRLERETSAYYENLVEEELGEEKLWGRFTTASFRRSRGK